MILIPAILSTLSTGYGIFLTKYIVKRYSSYEIIGPLFFLNALWIIPFGFSGKTSLDLKTILMLIFIGFLIFLGAVMVFLIIKRTGPSASIIGQSLSPAFVSFIAPVMFHQKFDIPTILIVIVLVIATLYPARNVVLGLSSTLTFLLMIVQGFNAGFINLLLTSVKAEGSNPILLVSISQVVAGIFATIVYYPKQMKISHLPIMTIRSFFMGAGWLLLVLALNKHSVVLVQSIISAVPLSVVVFESTSDRKKPEKGILTSSIVLIICITALSFLTIK